MNTTTGAASGAGALAREMAQAAPDVVAELHLGWLVGYSFVLLSLAGACWLGARCVQRSIEKRAASEALEGEYMPWAKVGSGGANPSPPWRPRLVEALRVGSYALTWWGMSVSFTLVNKYFLGYWRPPAREGAYVAAGFPFAVTTTAAHLSMKVALSTLTVKARARRLARRLASDEASHDEATSIVVPEPLSARARWRCAVPVGAATALDIACSNLSLLFITVSFYTVAKSSTLAWTLAWAVALKLEPCRPRTTLIVLLILVGVVLATDGERRNPLGVSLPGVGLVTGAACLGGLRWCLTQSLFSLDEACAEDPVVVVYHVSPAGVATLVPIALALEARKLAYWAGLVEPRGLAEAAAVSCCGGCIAYFMLLAEIQLLRSTSSLSLSVVGALKDVSQIALAAATFGDTLSPQSLSGMGVVVSASLAFAKYRERGTGDYRRQQARYRPVRLPTDDLDGDGFDDCDLADDDLSDNTLELAEF